MPAVFHTTEAIVQLAAPRLAALIQAAEQEPLRRSRICLHQSPSDLTQEMIIALCRDSYIAPHRHRGKSESFHMIQGELDVVFFDDRGGITQVVSLGPPQGDRPFLYRLSAPYWHTVLVKTAVAVFHETTTGPFVQGAGDAALWAPAPDDTEAVSRFMQRCREQLLPAR